MTRLLYSAILALLSVQHYNCCQAFVPVALRKSSCSNNNNIIQTTATTTRARAIHPRLPTTKLHLDLVTYLRTEWISAALFTNQTPRAANVCLQLGTEDGRAVTFLPRTIRELITSSADDKNGVVSVSARRQLKQNQERRGTNIQITYVDQRADDLKETESESVDVVITMNAAERMVNSGMDWKKGIREAARVLKPGGRLLFVEQTELNGESYLEYVQNLFTLSGEMPEKEEERVPIFDEVGYDDIDLVITPHVAGVAIKSEDAGLSPAERAKKEADLEKQRIADLSIAAYERGLKKRKRKKKGETTTESAASTTTSASK